MSDTGDPLSYHGIYHMLRRSAEQACITPPRPTPTPLEKSSPPGGSKTGGDEQRLMALGGWNGPEMLRIYVRLGHLDALRQGHADYSPVDGVLE